LHFSRTITKPAPLGVVVSKVRKTGWAVSDDEFAAGVVGCAVPIRNTEGKLIAGLGISVPSARLSPEKLTQFRPKMEKAASAIVLALET
jgi:DNA-binding IclR family transcriptional regulator